jgi:hypothetical protein
MLGTDRLPAAFYNFPPKQQVVAFLVETIDWYRLLSVEQQIATGNAGIFELKAIRDGVPNPKEYRSPMPAKGGADLTSNQLAAVPHMCGR